MKLQKSWAVAKKDFDAFRAKKSDLYSMIAASLVAAIGLPALMWLPLWRTGISPPEIVALLNQFSLVFIILAGLLPNAVASYSIVGEKIERTLEPLLATPTTDGEILLGKGIAAFLPSIVLTYAGAAIFMCLMDALTASQLGYLFFPNWTIALILALAAPLACIFCIEFNVIVSSQVSDIRAAQQLGLLVLLPFAGLYAAAQMGFVSVLTTDLLIISAIVLLVDTLLFYASRATFRREEILTKWK